MPHSTLVASLAGVELNAVGADGPIARPRPPPPERGDDWRDATSSESEEEDVAPPPVGPADDCEERWRQEARDSPESCWGRLQSLEDVAGDDRDPVCDQLVKALTPLDLFNVWDDRTWLEGTMTLREAARLCSFDAAINLIVDGYDLPRIRRGTRASSPILWSCLTRGTPAACSACLGIRTSRPASSGQF